MKAHVEIHLRLDLADGKTLHDVLREFAEQTKGWTFPMEEATLLTAAGREIPIEVNVSTVRDEVRGVTGPVPVFRDITEAAPGQSRFSYGF